MLWKNRLWLWLGGMELMERVGICENFCGKWKGSCKKLFMDGWRYWNEKGLWI